jgi:protein-tyrosine-phosphatase
MVEAGFVPTLTYVEPDPYYGGEQGFEEVFELLSMNADPLLDYLNDQR